MNWRGASPLPFQDMTVAPLRVTTMRSPCFSARTPPANTADFPGSQLSSSKFFRYLAGRLRVKVPCTNSPNLWQFCQPMKASLSLRPPRRMGSGSPMSVSLKRRNWVILDLARQWAQETQGSSAPEYSVCRGSLSEWSLEAIFQAGHPPSMYTSR